MLLTCKRKYVINQEEKVKESMAARCVMQSIRTALRSVQSDFKPKGLFQKIPVLGSAPCRGLRNGEFVGADACRRGLRIIGL